MKRSIFDKRIPTLLAFLLIIGGIGAATVFVQRNTYFNQHASGSEAPVNVHVTNRTDTSFTVTYTTTEALPGTVSLRQMNNAEQIYFDDRDERTKISQPYTVHSITIKTLQPTLTYYFSITSGSGTYLNNGSLFTYATLPSLEKDTTNAVELKGEIIAPTGESPPEGLVIATTPNGQLISTLTNSQGEYILSLPFSQPQPITITLSGQNQSSTVVVSSDMKDIPLVTLSKDYDFTQTTQPLSQSFNQSPSFPAFSVEKPPSGTISITTPQQNNNFVDQQPLFKGTALPNARVIITIHSDKNIQTAVTANAFGQWSYRPDTQLSPGQHTITIATKNTFGITQTVTQTFTVFSSGSQVFQSATPSATPTTKPTQAPTNTPVPSATPTVTPTVTPSIIPTDTPTPTLVLASPTPTPLIFGSPTSAIPTPTRKPLPPTGSNTTFVIGITGLISAALGVILFFAL